MASIISRKKKISEIVIDEIRRMIEIGEIKEGDKLPNQYEFAEQLGVSRPSLREALNQLTAAGVVEQKPGAGTILKVDNPDLWFGLPYAPMLSDTKATLELIEARMEIEPIAIKLAAEKMNKADFKMIEKSITRMEEFFAAGNIHGYLKEDLTFHYLIAKSGHNRYILQMLINIKLLMEEFMRESFEEIAGLLGNSLEHHHAIFEALRKKDKVQSAERLKSHIADIDIAIREYYKQNKMMEGRS